MEFEDSWKQNLVPQSEDLAELKGFSGGWLLCFSDIQVEPQYVSLGFYYLCYKLIPTPLKIFHKLEMQGILLSSFYVTMVILTPKLHETQQRKTVTDQIPL